MKKKILFWWHYITDSSFRAYVHTHDAQAFIDEIQRMIREKSEYESRQIYLQDKEHKQ
jgi:hypothetical protein